MFFFLVYFEIKNFIERKNRNLERERMSDFIDLFEEFQQHFIEKQKFIEIQREDVHQSINRTFNKIFEQLIEIRRFCRNDIEQQTLNAQVNSSKNLQKTSISI